MLPNSAKQHEVERKPEAKRGGRPTSEYEGRDGASQPRVASPWLDSDRIEALPHRGRQGQTRRKSVGPAVSLEAPSHEGAQQAASCESRHNRLGS